MALRAEIRRLSRNCRHDPGAGWRFAIYLYMPYTRKMIRKGAPITVHGLMGRPPTHPKRLLLAVSEDFLRNLDEWRRRQPGVIPTRSDAIRYLVERGIEATAPKPPRKP